MPGRILRMVLTAALLFVFAVGVYAKDWGTVKVDGKNIAIELQLNKKTKVVVTPKGTRFPVGTYVPISWTYMKRDRAGKVWSITGQTKSFTVEKDQTTVLENIALIEVSGYLGSKTQNKKTRQISYSVYPVFKGKNGQSCGSYAHRGAARMSPTYRIEDERGRVFAQGTFGFG